MKYERYIKFYLYDKNPDMPIVVRIEKDKDIDYDILKKINQATKEKIKSVIKWNNDFDFIDEIMKSFANKYNFQYQIIFADINIYGY